MNTDVLRENVQTILPMLNEEQRKNLEGVLTALGGKYYINSRLIKLFKRAHSCIKGPFGYFFALFHPYVANF